MNIKQGENKNFKFQILNLAGEVNTEVVSDIVFTLATELPCGQTTTVVTKKLGDGITFDDNTYYYLLSFEPADTINLAPGNYPFDIKVRREDLQYFVLTKGILKISKSYTGVI